MDKLNEQRLMRLKTLIADLGFRNPARFSLALGYDRPEALYKVLRGQNQVSLTLIDKIASTFPDHFDVR